jgi:hypothetical protein
MYNGLPLEGRGTSDKGLGLLNLAGGKSNDVAALKGNGKLFALWRPRNYRWDKQHGISLENCDTHCSLERSLVSLRYSTQQQTAWLTR